MTNSVHEIGPLPFPVNIPEYDPGCRALELPGHRELPGRKGGPWWYIGRAGLSDVWTNDEWKVVTTSVMRLVATEAATDPCPCFIDPDERAKLLKYHENLLPPRIHLQAVGNARNAMNRWLHNVWPILFERCCLDGVKVDMGHQIESRNTRNRIRIFSDHGTIGMFVASFSEEDNMVMSNYLWWSEQADDAWKDRILTALRQAPKPEGFVYVGFVWEDQP